VSDEISDLYVNLSANTSSFVAQMAGATTASKDLEDQSSNTSKMLLGIGVAALAAAAGLVAWGVTGADTFNQKMTLIRTQANDTTDDLGTMSQAVLNMAGAVGQTPDALADALYHITSAGFTGAQALDLLKSSADLADVGQSNLTDTTNGLIAMLRSGVPDVKNSAQAIGMLNAIVGSGNMTMDDLVGSLSKFMPVAGTFGVSAQSMGAALDTMTDQGYGSAQAATALRMTIAMMAAPTAASAGILKDLGLTATQTGSMTAALTEALAKSGVTQTQLASDMKQPDGLAVALTDLKSHMVDAGVSAQEQADIIARAFGGGKTGAAILDLYNNIGTVQQKFIDIGGAVDNWSGDLATQMGTNSQHILDFQATVDAMRIDLGDIFAPMADSAVKAFQGTLMVVGPAAISWVKDDAVPAIDDFGRFFEDDLVPAVESAGTALLGIAQVGGSAVTDVFGFIVNDLGPPLEDVLGFISNNGWVIDAIFGAWAARWVAMKAMGIATEVLQWGAAFSTFATVSGSTSAAMAATLGMGGTGGLSGAIRGVSEAAAGLGTTGAAAFESFGVSAATAVPAVAGVGEASTAAIPEVVSLGAASDATATAIAAWAASAPEAAAGVEGIGVAAATATPEVAAVGVAGDVAAAGLGAMLLPLGIMAAGAAIVTLALNWNSVTSALQGFFDPAGAAADQLQKLNEAAQQSLATDLATNLQQITQSLRQAAQTDATYSASLLTTTGAQDQLNESQQNVPKQLQAMANSYQQLNEQLAIAEQGTETISRSGTTWTVDLGQVEALQEQLANLKIPAAVTASWSTFSDEAQDVFNELATTSHGSGVLISEFYTQLQKDNGNTEEALDQLAASGNKNWTALAASAQTAAEQVQQTQQQTLVQGSMTAWDTIEQVYGAGTAAAAAALKGLSPAQQEVVTDLQNISTQSGISMSDLESLGSAGVIDTQVNVNGHMVTLTGTLQDVIQQLENAQGAVGVWGLDAQQATAEADSVIETYLGTLSQVAQEQIAASNWAATDEDPVKPPPSPEPVYSYDSGGVSTSAALAWVSGNGEPEAHIPQSMAGPMWPYLLGLLGGAPASSGGGGGGLASASAAMGAAATGGGSGGGVVIQIGSVTLQGISNPQEFIYELQNLALSAAKGQGIPSLFGSY
jgi:TP901 family phage tail tape measure protein